MAFITLTALELVLGIDNIIFISILVEKLPKEQREIARRIGLFLAMFMRIGLLMTLAWIAGLTEPVFNVMNHGVSGRDIILLAGGLFLLWKSTQEIHQLLEGIEGQASSTVKNTFFAIIVQIIIIDLVFSLDSIITAVGMVSHIPVMIAAVVASVGLMMMFAGYIGAFIEEHPTIKMLALAFLLVVGVVLIADGTGYHVPKGDVYFAMAFSIAVESLNISLRKRANKPVDLHESYATDEDVKNG
jgi:predicted tellurium resistance membrane protein TerC